MPEFQFIDQIKEDLRELKRRQPYLARINEEDYAFNYWVLDKLYSVDEHLFVEHVTDGSQDCGIDCYVWDKDNKDLYIIQNKYYAETTSLETDYIKREFLTQPIELLEQGIYTKSPSLQRIYNTYSSDPDFSVYLKLYITHENFTNQEILDEIDIYNTNNINKNRRAEIVDLKGMKKIYYGDEEFGSQRPHFDFTFLTPNKGTVLNVNKKDYGLATDLDAKYALISNYEIYRLIEKAKAKGYPIFDKNIREFLGSKVSVNKKIRNTLKSDNDRKNFFFYNNGITIVLKDFKEESSAGNGRGRSIKIFDPQIVNGCQTVSTIHEVISEYKESERKELFSTKQSSVMVKFIKTQNEELYSNIVRYNNSQNGIKDKDFIANRGIFKSKQKDFLERGLLLIVKQSDKYKFQEKYDDLSPLLSVSGDDLKKFGLYKDRPKVKDLFVDLEKMLQSIVAFVDKPVNAVQNKSKLLIPESTQYSLITNFIQSCTGKDLYYLALLSMKANNNLFNVEEKTGANPFYIIHFFKTLECNGKSISDFFVDYNKEKVEKLFKTYNLYFRKYYLKWREKYEKSYLDLIKSEIDNDILNKAIQEVDDDLRVY